MGVNKGLFTNGCKKVLKYVSIADPKILKIEVQEGGLGDIFAKIVKPHLVPKEEQKSYKKLYSKSIFYNAKHLNNYPSSTTGRYLGL
ncbi:MAG: hypothetical protein L3J43_04440 [Sulfurovum sp.]|nr:hypothetical protein [Sulfurovum sp.]